jgi:NADPH2:quinone reductase
MSQSMIALFGGFGPDLLRREVPVPEPGPTQVLVRVHAVALNNVDPQMLAQAYDVSTGTGTEYLAGYEFAGDVVSVGSDVEDVEDVEVGWRVMGTTPRSFAQYVACDHRHLIRVPDSLGYEQACALTTGLLTEYGALRRGGFVPGSSVAVTGATSGIGLIGIQVAKALGATTVIGTTRSQDRARLLRNAGADVVIVTSTQVVSQSLLNATGGRGVDVVLDHVGGQVLASCLPGTGDGGSVINIGRLGGAEAFIDLDALSYRHLTLRGVSFGFDPPEQIGDVIAALTGDVMAAVADGRIRPVIDAVYPFDQANDAIARVRGGRAEGKVVLTMS